MSLLSIHRTTDTPTLDTSAYADGDHLGSLMTIETGSDLGQPSILRTLTLLDKADQGAALDVLLFDESPTIASSDNDALSITDAEMEKCIGFVSVTSGDYQDFGGASVACIPDERLVVKPKSGSSKVYALLVSRGTPTYAADSIILGCSFEHARS